MQPMRFEDAITIEADGIVYHDMFDTGGGATRDPIRRPAIAGFSQSNSQGSLRPVESLKEVFELGQEAALEMSELLPSDD